MIRVVAIVLAVALSALCLIGSWPQLLGLHRNVVFAELAALRGLLVLIALGGIVLLGILAVSAPRLRRVAAGFALALLTVVAINLAVLGARGVGTARAEPEGAGDITVLAWNTLGDAPGSAAVARLALEEDADIVALPETSAATADEIAAAMTEAGSPMQSLTVSFDEVAKARSTSLLIARHLGAYTLDESAGSTPQLPSAIAVPVDGDGPTIVAAHPVAPVPEYIDDWEPGLRWLADACDRGDVILAGDLNATLDHFHGLGRDGGDLGGCRDGAQERLAAALGTWPTQLAPLLGAPIDHVMATAEWEFVGFRVIASRDDAGSDHRPVAGRIRPVP